MIAGAMMEGGVFYVTSRPHLRLKVPFSTSIP